MSFPNIYSKFFYDNPQGYFLGYAPKKEAVGMIDVKFDVTQQYYYILYKYNKMAEYKDFMVIFEIYFIFPHFFSFQNRHF